MVRSPRYESPVGSVPESTDKEYPNGIPYYLGLAYSTAAKRYIHIIPEPCGERDVPPAPKLGYVAAEIRHVEVTHQLDAEQLGCAYGYVGISRKITVYLESE